MNDIVKTIKSLEYSNILTDGITETAKHEKKEKKKKKEGGFPGALLAPSAASLV